MLVPGKRDGCYLYDINGTRYINCHSNGGVFNLGHRNRRIIRAVSEAMKQYDIGNHHLVSEPKARLGELLASSMPAGLNQVVYGVSGGEAVDLAIKLARGVTGRAEIISAKGGYHGHTGLALATGDRKFREKFGPSIPGFRQVRFNDIGSLEKALSKKTAAVVFETIPATMGIVVPAKDFYRKVKLLCESNGTLLIMDEIQTGFGRTGSMWGFDQFNVVPDIVTLGKGMSGGIYPITATVYKEKYAGFFREDPFVHISTFGGSEIGCLVAIEVMRITGRGPFLKHVNAMGKFFSERLDNLSRKYPSLKLRVRGLGLMMGLEFKDEMTALFVMKHLFDEGIYLVYSSNDPKVLQFMPVLTITKRQGADIMHRMDQAFAKMGR
ncbi:MAG TPA: aminotransferase class III-fold pyridoxal phosphate-dependent enzyme [Spirochaetota bacterium]|nr:aminotransferase class III-fold pyridoxal phosphate-dependent enzyme [Spirochaetota bacterium]HPC39524.1 aminotransferase class III-fold pyridoxal phosphate-dependent enzyme [Spirochaetota bacterium]HPL15242.1 aminotransferase class III-fold pyridoxal phosphate-dependent enzyme [Spirochaetota bacterium]HQJ69098.1 aminotransferase class III-fold pyridoxal phosphate-dependent enzyme [Spirochaetota bacterium]HRS75938.1 aminotransferase class III-fold pyridoxal phosphate-dependent enzyme [Spiroc